MKHKRDDGPEKQEDEAVDVTPVMICVFVVMCCSMLVLLYYFYDQLGASLAHPRGNRGPGPQATLRSLAACLWGERRPPLPAQRRGPPSIARCWPPCPGA